MKQVVHILATVRKPELLRAALLVFSTLRTGFPTADVCVWGNGLTGDAEAMVAMHALAKNCRYHNLPGTSHDCWIEGLIAQAVGAFWICDTDIVFHENFEQKVTKGTKDAILMGRFEPDFHEEFTDTVHVARLHTCLMWMDGPGLRCAMRGWMARFPLPWRNSAQYDLVHQHFIPRAGGLPLFYDSMAGVYQMMMSEPPHVGCYEFNEEENACFDHLHFATYVDQVEGRISVKGGLRERFEAVYDDPSVARGIFAEQRRYYAARAVVRRSGLNAKAAEGCRSPKASPRSRRVAVHGGDGANVV